MAEDFVSVPPISPPRPEQEMPEGELPAAPPQTKPPDLIHGYPRLDWEEAGTELGEIVRTLYRRDGPAVLKHVGPNSPTLYELVRREPMEFGSYYAKEIKSEIETRHPGSIRRIILHDYLQKRLDAERSAVALALLQDAKAWLEPVEGIAEPTVRGLVGVARSQEPEFERRREARRQAMRQLGDRWQGRSMVGAIPELGIGDIGAEFSRAVPETTAERAGKIAGGGIAFWAQTAIPALFPATLMVQLGDAVYARYAERTGGAAGPPDWSDIADTSWGMAKELGPQQIVMLLGGVLSKRLGAGMTVGALSGMLASSPHLWQLTGRWSAGDSDAGKELMATVGTDAAAIVLGHFLRIRPLSTNEVARMQQDVAEMTRTSELRARTRAISERPRFEEQPAAGPSILAPESVRRLVAENPEAAKQYAAIEKPSRTDFERLTGSGAWVSFDQRKALRDAIARELLPEEIRAAEAPELRTPPAPAPGPITHEVAPRPEEPAPSGAAIVREAAARRLPAWEPKGRAEPAPTLPEEKTGGDFGTLYHGSTKPIVGILRPGRAKETMKTRFGQMQIVGTVFDGVFLAKTKRYAKNYSALQEEGITEWRLSPDAQVLSLPDIVSEEVLTRRGLGRSAISSLPKPTKSFPFQSDFEDYAFRRLNAARQANNKIPFDRDVFDKRTQGEWNPSNPDYDLQGLASKYLPDYIKSKGYDAVELGREVIVLNPKKIIRPSEAAARPPAPPPEAPLSWNALRARAKELGVKATGTRAQLEGAISDAEASRAGAEARGEEARPVRGGGEEVRVRGPAAQVRVEAKQIGRHPRGMALATPPAAQEPPVPAGKPEAPAQPPPTLIAPEWLSRSALHARAKELGVKAAGTRAQLERAISEAQVRVEAKQIGRHPRGMALATPPWLEHGLYRTGRAAESAWRAAEDTVRSTVETLRRMKATAPYAHVPRQLADQVDAAMDYVRRNMNLFDRDLKPFVRAANRPLGANADLQKMDAPAAPYGRAVGRRAMEDVAYRDTLPPEQRALVDLADKVRENTGRTLEANQILQENRDTGEIGLFRSGKPEIPRSYTDAGVAALMTQGPASKFWEPTVVARAKGNMLQETHVETEMRRQRVAFAESRDPSGAKTIAAEHARIWPYEPDWVKAPDGEVLWLHEPNLAKAIPAMARAVAGRIGYSRHFGQDFGPNWQKRLAPGITYNPPPGETLARQFAQIHPESTVFQEIGQGLHGESPRFKGEAFQAGEFGSRALNAWSQVISTLDAGRLSGSWLVQLPELMANIQAAGGRLDMPKALWRIVRHPNLSAAELQAKAVTYKAVLDYSLDSRRPIETFFRIARNLVYQGTPFKAMNDLWAKLSAETVSAMNERAKAGKGTRLDVIEYESWGMDPAKARRLASGQGTPIEYDALVRQAPSRLTAQAEMGPERSRLQQTAWYRQVFPFTGFPAMNLRRLLDYGGPFIRHAGRGEWKDTLAAGAKIARLLGGHAIAGEAGYLLASWAVRGELGLQMGMQELEERPLQTLMEAMGFQLLGGAMGNLLRGFSGRTVVRAYGGVEALEAIGRGTRLGYTLFELRDFLSGEGPYYQMDRWDKVSAAIRRMLPGIGVVTGLYINLAGAPDTVLDRDMRTAVRTFWGKMREAGFETGAEGAREGAFYVHMKKAQALLRAGQDPESELTAAMNTPRRDADSVRQSLLQRILFNPTRFKADKDPFGETNMAAFRKTLLPEVVALLDRWDSTHRQLAEELYVPAKAARKKRGIETRGRKAEKIRGETPTERGVRVEKKKAIMDARKRGLEKYKAKDFLYRPRK